MNFEDAITRKVTITFIYDGLDREVQPATLGITSTGKLGLRACLIGGSSRRNTLPCWELYTVDKMDNPRTTANSFVDFAVAGYTKGDSVFKQIFAEH